jgi:hypothetical protein
VGVCDSWPEDGQPNGGWLCRKKPSAPNLRANKRAAPSTSPQPSSFVYISDLASQNIAGWSNKAHQRMSPLRRCSRHQTSNSNHRTTNHSTRRSTSHSRASPHLLAHRSRRHTKHTTATAHAACRRSHPSHAHDHHQRQHRHQTGAVTIHHTPHLHHEQATTIPASGPQSSRIAKSLQLWI